MPDAQKPPQEPHQRVVVYLDPRDHRRLKAKLALRGSSVSEWFRQMVRRLLG